MKRMLTVLFLVLAASLMMRAQGTSTLPTATPTQANVPWTAGSCPTQATSCGTGVQRCQGTAATCTTSSSNWTNLTTAPLTGTSGTFLDLGVASGLSYCYSVVNYWVASGSTSNAAPSPVGCVVVPLAGTPASLGTLSASS